MSVDTSRLADTGRLEALRLTGLMDSVAERSFDRLTGLASRWLGVPVVLVSLVDDCRQFFKSAVGLPEPWATSRETPLSHSFCRVVVESGEPLVVADAREDPRLRTNLAIRDLGVIAYLGIPIRVTTGEVLGSFCAIDGQPRQWTTEEIETMNDLAASVIGELELRRELARREVVEQRLRDNDQFIEHILHVSPTFLYIFGLPEKRLLWTSGKNKENLGYSREFLLSLDEDHLLELVHPDDLGRFVESARGFATMKDGETIETEYRFRRTDGTWRWLRARRVVSSRDASGQPDRILGLLEDISERKQIEDLSRKIFEISTDAHLIYDEDEGILDCNEVAVRLLGYPSKEDLLRQHPTVFSPEYQLDGIRSTERRRGIAEVVFRDGFHRFDWLHQRANGEVFPCEVSLSKADVAGRTVFLVVWHDLTERKRIEEDLRHAKETAEAASRAKGEFLANMSHEIRTPMNGVLGMTELLLDTDLSDLQRDYLGLVDSSAKALLTVINDILDFSKIEAGKLDLDPVIFDLHDHLTLSLRPQAFRCDSKGLDLVLRIGQEVPRVVEGDPDRLRQVLSNLVGNAIKFTNDGQIAVEVELVAISESPARIVLRFSIIDTGVGIPLEKQQAIFEPFEQADSSTTRSFGGTGLGLTISAKLVVLMGGKIEVASEPGRGSRFSFTSQFGLPIETSEDRPPMLAPFREIAVTSRKLGKGFEEPMKRLKILLAEDQSINQKVAVTLLERIGHATSVVANGRDALDQIASGCFDVVLMDVQMPEMDGVEAVQRLRQVEQDTGRRTPVVALTAHTMSGDRERYLAAGFDDYLPKPVRSEDLREVLDRLVLSRRWPPLKSAVANDPSTPA